MRANQRVAVPVVYVAAMFMTIMDTTIVSTALPSLGRDLHARPDAVGLVSIAYLVALTVFIPASGWLGDRIGPRRALLGAIGLFTLASALCGMSTSLGELVAFRIVQGIGGAVMTPVGLAMLFRVYPPAERLRVASILAVFTALAPALGPILGGLLTTEASWRWVFFVNVPIGVATLAYGTLALAPHRQENPGRLDLAGLVLSGLGLGLAMYGVSEGPIQGWSNTAVLTAIVAGAALLGTMVIVELRAARPLVALRLLGNRLFATSTSLYGLGSVSYIGALYLSALFLQNALGLSALQSGLATFPSALGVMAGGQIVTRALYPRLGPRRIVVSGLALVAATMVAMAEVGAGTSLWSVQGIMLGLGLGISFVFIPAQAASMATISKAQTGQASPIFNAGKQLGSAIGVALVTAVLGVVGPTRQVAGHVVANLAAYHDGFLVSAAIALAAIVVALAVRNSDAEATMIPTGAGRSNRARERAGPVAKAS